MKENYTHISVILDRSGSMESIREDVVGGFNAFLGEQKRTEGLATLSLVQFDTQNPYEVLHSFTLVQAVQPLIRETYVPRGGTPLLDAMGRGINDLEQSLGAMREADRPARVVMVFVTDGQENSSREFSREQVARMISAKQEVAGWQFVYLSADLDAVNDAIRQYGVRATQAMAFDKNAQGSQAAFASVSANVASYRRYERADMAFSEEDRALHEAEKKRK
jgi:Mg-chelatase subunit ChlD